jgi:hypothetical protein
MSSSRFDRRVTREGIVSVGGNLYSAPDCTPRRVVEVHAFAILILENDKLIAIHPFLEGRGQRRIAGGHRKAPPPRNSWLHGARHDRHRRPRRLRLRRLRQHLTL